MRVFTKNVLIARACASCVIFLCPHTIDRPICSVHWFHLCVCVCECVSLSPSAGLRAACAPCTISTPEASLCRFGGVCRGTPPQHECPQHSGRSPCPSPPSPVTMWARCSIGLPTVGACVCVCVANCVMALSVCDFVLCPCNDRQCSSCLVSVASPLPLDLCALSPPPPCVCVCEAQRAPRASLLWTSSRC